MHIVVKTRFDRLLLIEGGTFIIYATAVLLFTETLLDLHGITLNRAGIFTAQMAGAVFFAFSALNLMARQITDAKALHLIVNVNFIKHILCLAVSGWNYMTGTFVDVRGLSFVLLFALFSIVFGYFYFSSTEYVNSEYLQAEDRAST